MNLGSSKKWVELLGSHKEPMNDGVGLRWADGRFSPVGILEDFITKTWKTSAAHSGCYLNGDGNLALASAECRKRVKAKTSLELVDDLATMPVEEICRFIEANYEAL